MSEPYGSGAENLAGHEFFRSGSRKQHLKNARVLFFQHRTHHAHAVHQDGHIEKDHQQQRGEEQSQSAGVGHLAVLDLFGINVHRLKNIGYFLR